MIFLYLSGVRRAARQEIGCESEGYDGFVGQLRVALC